MKRKSMITMLVIALMLVLSLTVLSACGKKMYQLTVTGGTGGGEYAEGATVTITANAPETGKEFTSWTIEGVTVDDKTKTEITFTMPANAVTATANYGDVLYEFALENCTADKETAKFGEEVTFTADEIIGKRFDSWNIKGVDDLTGLDLTKSPLTFTMPANDINVAAVLEDIDYTVTVTGGTTDKETAHYGDTVTIKANAPATGKEFTGWTIEGVTVENTSVTELTFTMPAGNVTATANYESIDYTVTVVYGTANKTTAHYGDSITITADEITGREFMSWTINGVSVDDKTKAEITFTMPAGNVTAKANYVYNNYKVTVNGGTANKTTAHYGDSITITANKSETGKRFTGWTITGVDTSELVLTNRELTFTMPANVVTATANYDFIYYNVTVNGGKAQVNDGVASASVKAHYGEEVTITAEVPVGKEFVMWSFNGLVSDGLTLTDAELTFTMPAGNVTAKANYVYNNYKVTVNGGTANKTTAHYGDSITITANKSEAGKRFTGWTITGVDTSELVLTNRELTFTMPANVVTATANYDFINYNVTVNGGKAQVNDGVASASVKAHYGEEVTITAEVPVGKEFVMWSFNGLVSDGLTLTDAELTFTMPAGNVVAKANYEFINYNVTVNGGTANKATAHYGEEVTITAEVPVGKEFVMWSFDGLVPGGLSLTDAELTFTMPTNAVTATAVFEDIDYEVKVVCRNTETKTAHYGEEVTITAENIEGKIFVCWAFTNLDTEGLDLTRAELSFTMPANNVTAKAIYDELITLTFEGTTAKSEALQYKVNDSKSFRLPLGSGQDSCTYTIELSNSAFTFKVYGSDGVEIEPYDNGDGFMCIDIAREDNYTIRVVNTGAAANCTLTVTQI